jgi:hypothetical protein
VTLTDLPLNILPLDDGTRILIATSGYNKHELSLVDLATATILASQAVNHSWFGLVMSPKDHRVWWSGGGANQLHQFELRGTKLRKLSVEMASRTVRTRSEVRRLRRHIYNRGQDDVRCVGISMCPPHLAL